MSYINLLFSDMTNGRIGDMCEMGVTESYQVKKQVLTSAAEAAEMIVRVDNIVKAAPRWETAGGLGFASSKAQNEIRYKKNVEKR